MVVPEEIEKVKLPQHVAIIMDGNGRWAQKRKLSRSHGHIEGVKRVEEIVDAAQEMGIKILTLYTFSTENWKRPQNEIGMLMDILMAVLKRKVEKLQRNNIRFQTMGRKERIPPVVLQTIDEVTDKTKDNDGIIVNLAFNYGSRTEILDAVKEVMGKVRSGEIDSDKITEDTISRHLYTKDLPDPDLLIRTSGEKRISNFLLWQLSYSEFYFTETLWPDFHVEEFKVAVNDYVHRDRRFGNLSDERGHE